MGFIYSHWLQAKEEPEGPSHCSEGGPPDELQGPAEPPRFPTGAALVPPGGPFRSAQCSSPPPHKAAQTRIAEAAALERTPSREQNLGHRQERDQVGALGSPGSGQAVRRKPACPRESAVVSACWLAPLHLTALAPTPPWRLPRSGYNSETVRITPRHLAPHAS